MILSPGFPLLHTVHAAFTAHGVPSGSGSVSGIHKRNPSSSDTAEVILLPGIAGTGFRGFRYHPPGVRILIPAEKYRTGISGPIVNFRDRGSFYEIMNPPHNGFPHCVSAITEPNIPTEAHSSIAVTATSSVRASLFRMNSAAYLLRRHPGTGRKTVFLFHAFLRSDEPICSYLFRSPLWSLHIERACNTLRIFLTSIRTHPLCRPDPFRFETVSGPVPVRHIRGLEPFIRVFVRLLPHPRQRSF